MKTPIKRPCKAPSMRFERIKLRRTFNMTFEGQTLKFWRVIAPITHPNINSDLTVEGLREWGII